MDNPQLASSVEDDPGEVTGSPGPELLWTKLVAPAPRAGLLLRAGLQSRLQAGLGAKLCLVAAPAIVVALLVFVAMAILKVPLVWTVAVLAPVSVIWTWWRAP